MNASLSPDSRAQLSSRRTGLALAGLTVGAAVSAAAAVALWPGGLFSRHGGAQSSLPPAQGSTSAQPAFPGAEGYGRLAQGGRGGRIIPVTTLGDSGPGSLRACIDARGARVCVFRVAGVIRFETERPVIRNPYITIAGETAPGGGILLTHAGGKNGYTPLVIKKTHDVIVRHIRVRIDRQGKERGSNDAFLVEKSNNVILDHVSGSWAQDENFNGFGQVDNLTVSWSIFAEGVPRHDKCSLLSSDPTGPQRISFIRNLCAHNGDRNPDANFYPGSCVEVVNNVFYNAISQFTEVWESFGGTPVSIVGNFYRRGPNTAPIAFTIDRQTIKSSGRSRIYESDNFADGDNLVIAEAAKDALVQSPACKLTFPPVSAAQAYSSVLQAAGAFPRDTVDQRIVSEVRTRTGGIGRDNRVLPLIGSAPPYPDSDGDGMSDDWERANRTNPTVADAWGDIDQDGWLNLDEFLDSAHQQKIAGR